MTVAGSIGIKWSAPFLALITAWWLKLQRQRIFAGDRLIENLARGARRLAIFCLPSSRRKAMPFSWPISVSTVPTKPPAPDEVGKPFQASCRAAMG